MECTVPYSYGTGLVVLYHLVGRKEASKSFNPFHKTLTETNANHISASFVEMREREGRGRKRKERGKKRLIINHSYR